MIYFTSDLHLNHTNIIKYRKEANITQEQLALDIDISYDHIRRMESTKGSEGLALETFIKISIVLGKNLDDFLKQIIYIFEAVFFLLV
jgi:DNA-binding XRE family transcriptional regulator